MANFDSLYKKVGITKLIHFLEPLIIKSDSFIFPDKSILYWFKPSDGIEVPSRVVPYLNKTNKVNVVTPVKFGTKVEGTVKESNDVKEAFKIMNREEKKYKFLPPNVIENKGDFIIYNYGLLNYIYSYAGDPNLNLIKYNNVANRMLDDLKSMNDYNRFILFELPNKLLSMGELDSFASKLTPGNANRLDPKYFNLIELWKWLTPATKNNSIFNRIANTKLNKTTLLLSIENRMVVINLEYLFALVEEYSSSQYVVNTESTVDEFLMLLGASSVNLETASYVKSKYNSSVIRYLIYIMLFKLITGKPIDYNKIDGEKVDEIAIKKAMSMAKKVEKENKLSMKDVLDAYIQETNDDIIALDMDTFIPETTDVDFAKLDAMDADIESRTNKTFASIEELKKYNYRDDLRLKTIAELDYLLETKAISKAMYDSYLEAFNKQNQLSNPFLLGKDGGNIETALDSSFDNFEINDIDATIAPNVMIFDEAINKNIAATAERQYLKEQYRKDIIRVVYSLQNLNNIILNYEVKENFDITGGVEEHIVEIMSLSGKKTTLRFDIPYIDEYGVFTVNGVDYSLRKLRAELPIRKIDATTALLTSYYGKMFIGKAFEANDSNIGRWIYKYLRNKESDKNKKYDSKCNSVIALGVDIPDVDIPVLYAQIASFVKSFDYGNYKFNFNHHERDRLLPDYTMPDIEALEKTNNAVIVGTVGNNFLMMDFANNIYELKGSKAELIGDFYSVVNIDTSDIPIEFVRVGILKEAIPAVLILSYYLGLDNLLKLLGTKYSLESGRGRVNENQYAIKFKDKTLIVDKDNGLSDLIVAGLLSMNKLLKDFPMDSFNKRSSYNVIWHKYFSTYSNLSSSVKYVNEINILETMYIDPMTANLLKQIKEPNNFPALIIRACEMVIDNNYRHPNNINDMVLKGYERVAGIIYTTLVDAYKDYENANAFSKSRIVLDRYAIMQKIMGDNSKITLDDLNPIAMIKQKEDTTYLGDGGRNKDGMVKRTRELNETEIGIISESTKDSGSVGVTAHMTANPNLVSINGLVGNNKEAELKWENMLSTPGMLAPFGLTDDAKRLNFNAIMSSHIIAIDNMTAPRILTGYETIIPIKAGPKFVITAEEEGTVIKVTKSELTVEYKTRGKKVYRLYSWTSKEEAGSCYTHEMVPNFKEGDLFIKDDSLVYDKLFFEPCVFNPRRVLYKQGTMITVMLSEDPQTWNDSIAISNELHTVLGTTLTKVKSHVIEKTDNILNLVEIGSKVDPNTTLYTVINSDMPIDETLDEKALGILSELAVTSPKAKVKGTVNKIIVFYNFDPETASDSIRKLIEYSDKVLMKATGYSGRVGPSYSIQGKLLEPNSIELKVYIDVKEAMGTGDKCIIGNQLKCTVGEVFDYNLTTESGDKIDAVFSALSISARIVNSPNLIGTTTTLLKKIEDDVLKMYFG